MAEIQTTTLEYHVVGCSGHSGHYRANNILVDIPTDQTSRWSGQDFPSPLQEQWILLRLNKPSLLRSVKFGKFHKNHPCNTKDFRIYAGPTSDTLTEVYKGSLKNDSTAEEFQIRSTTSTGVEFTTEYVKIVPLSAHSTSYHTSIWHVAFKGVSDAKHVQQIAEVYDKHTEDITTRIVLKYLRDRGFASAYRSLLTESQVKFENAIVERLHEAVLTGENASAEEIVSEAASSGLLVQYLSTISPTACWTQRTGDDADGDIPCARGGHAMCIDDKGGIIYIHGGFDGKESLDDFWSYSITDDRWTCITGHTGATSSGPGARSCHRMLFDETTGTIYLLGRLDDRDATEYSKIADKSNESTSVVPPTVGPQPRVTEMWLYHTQGPDQGSWTMSPGDGSETGPHTLSEHQMVLVNEKRKIYVCGGRYIDTEKAEVKESGWYIYDISNGSWTTSGPLLHESARFGHSMVYDPKLRHIFIMSGQQKDRDLTDMWAFNIDTEMAIEVCSDLADRMTLQRAVYDSTRHEIYMSCGIKKEHHSTLVYANSDWIYQFNPTNPLKRGRFVKIDPPKVTDEGEQASPIPRCAQQIVYHTASQAYFMHGGNAGTSRHDVHRGSPQVRLDDLWKLELVWPSVDTVIRQALLLIRSQKFNELTGTDPVAALVYLRTDISAVVDHSSPAETALFQGLMEQLIQSDPLESEEAHSTTNPHLAMSSRRKLFKELIKFFPDDSKEPSLDLLPLVVRSS